MKVELLYYTPSYHKLVESVARICYQSYDKVNEESHKMLKGIMGKGHLSVASVGNIVFGISFDKHDEVAELTSLSVDLTTYKEINNYIRWTFFDRKKNPDSKFNAVVSFNILALLDIINNVDNYYSSRTTLDLMLQSLKSIPSIFWFVDDTVKPQPVENVYCNVVQPQIGSPVILSEDYNALKDILTPYELDIHCTVTIDWVTDRATGLQAWRHGDQTGGCELSQRYVDRSNADYRKPTDLTDMVSNAENELLRQHSEELLMTYSEWMREGISKYEKVKELLSFMGKKRSQEIARNLLPNVHTRIIQCRPLKQWKHFFKLRDTPHAQLEIMHDTQSIKTAFNKAGIKFE